MPSRSNADRLAMKPVPIQRGLASRQNYFVSRDRIFGKRAAAARDVTQPILLVAHTRTRTHKRPFGHVTVTKRYTDLYTFASPCLYKSNANFCPEPRVVALNEIEPCQDWVLARLKDSVVMVLLASVATSV
jgi:hypothetical protein